MDFRLIKLILFFTSVLCKCYSPIILMWSLNKGHKINVERGVVSVRMINIPNYL